MVDAAADKLAFNWNAPCYGQNGNQAKKGSNRRIIKSRGC
jgi:hypothetical protein